MRPLPPLRLVVVDDQRLFRETLSQLLAKSPGIRVLGQASSGAELFALLTAATPDLILLDLDMPGLSGLECAERLAVSHPSLPVLILTMHEVAAFREASQQLPNVRDYLTKNTDFPTLLRAIHLAARGAELTAACSPSPATALTRQERAVMRLILAQRSNEQISATLFNSIRTIEVHRRNLYQKTGARTLVGIVLYSLRHGLITLEELEELAQAS